MAVPFVSILIPNFNNGRDSSLDGGRDFIDELIRSLVRTLADDPTPLEIIVADDGSTDDSLATLRKWASRRWPRGWREGEPLLRLIELVHGGVLSAVANRLVDEARGEILVRLDGDIVVHTAGWAGALCRAFESGPPDLGVIGPKQLAPSGRIHAAGDWLLHPRGYHHAHQGRRAAEVTRAIEVDHVMGCFYGWKRAVWEDVGRFDESILRGQTIDYGLRARLHGWRCWCVPTIEFTHFHGQRAARASAADTGRGMAESRRAFAAKWGFDRLAPDLDEVARRYAGTPLLWNATVFGPASDGVQSHPVLAGDAWRRYAEDSEVRSFINARLDFVDRVRQSCNAGRRVIEVGCGTGLLTHLLAKRGFRCLGIDADRQAIETAERMTGQGDYEVEAPTFRLMADRRCLPVEEYHADMVTLLDVIERHPNPVGLLTEAHRVLKPGGVLAILTDERRGGGEEAIDGLHRYRVHELVSQVQHVGLFDVLAAPSPGQGTLPLIAKARCVAEAHHPGERAWRGAHPAANMVASSGQRRRAAA